MLDCVLGERKALLHVSETIMIIKKDYYYFFITTNINRILDMHTRYWWNC